MADPRVLLILAAPQEPSPFASLVPMGLVLIVFYFIVMAPMRQKQKKLEQLQKELKAGDKVIVSPGILGTVAGMEGDALVVRIAEQTKIKVLRSAVAGLQATSDTEKK